MSTALKPHQIAVITTSLADPKIINRQRQEHGNERCCIQMMQPNAYDTNYPLTNTYVSVNSAALPSERHIDSILEVLQWYCFGKSMAACRAAYISTHPCITLHPGT